MMKIVALLLGLSCVLADIEKPDVHLYDMMPSDDDSNSTGNLGICYGSSTTWSSRPYTVALRSTTGGACCSGTIISLNPGVILTAAHCDGCRGQVRIGCDNPSNCNSAAGYTISQFVQNPSYGRPLQLSNDIAVVRLSSAITVAGAQTRAIPSVEPSLGRITVTGYGVNQAGQIPTSLQTMTSNEMDRTECASLMRDLLGGNYIDDSMICILGGSLGSENVPTMCSGDSGGPMVVGNFVYGANSWVLQGSGTGCNSCSCCPGYPQVGSSSAENAAWIRGYMEAWQKGDYNYTYSA
mmetsp:Transcript_14234/g.22236  ORF Transcript_14234/g.22236 Transcript_14234/m.22236 type:complete len:295 (+) Transcript_14234:56-940(+)|eukprot:CAMPEP_0197029634 /NCGR_PEP_ID=MMETSP1384-20130603/9043_1 /TAXON_ID=29189 /ORGANISM="Ammonia sp." /LENGTH=294 /DNA_ID=CAMNT_0042458839 /DNA_START=40 /DNA_END=924 /DNA_ORIENTATION=+